MELNRFAVQHNQVVGKFNGLLARFKALQRENERLKEEAVEWKRRFLACQKDAE